MKHLTKIFLTLSLIVTLTLGVLADIPSRRTSPRVPLRSLAKPPKQVATNQTPPKQPTPIQHASGHRPVPSTPTVVVVDTTSPIHLLDDLPLLFKQVHYAAFLICISLVFKASYDVSWEEVSWEGREDKKEMISERIVRVVKGIFMSRKNPKVHSLAIFSLFVNRFIIWKFTVESFFGLDKYIDPATFNFARLVAPFYFARYIYCVPDFIKEQFSEPVLGFIASVPSCLSYFFPVIAVVVAALGEIIFFVLSMFPEKKQTRVKYTKRK